jgi:hypothetical protein
VDVVPRMSATPFILAFVLNFVGRGYQLWNTILAGQTPCYSSLGSFLSPPPVPVGSYTNTSDTSTLSGNNTVAASYTTTSPSISRISGNYTATTSYTTSSLSTSTASGTDTVTTTFTTVSTTTATQKPTSAVVNIVYALYYPIQPRNTLSTGAKAGIGTGASLAGISIIILSILLIWRTRKHKAVISAIQANGQRQECTISSSASPYDYSSRTELPSGEIPVEAPSHEQVSQIHNPLLPFPHHTQGQAPFRGPVNINSREGFHPLQATPGFDYTAPTRSTPQFVRKPVPGQAGLMQELDARMPLHEME